MREECCDGGPADVQHEASGRGNVTVPSITANLCLHRTAGVNLNMAKQPQGPRLLSKAALFFFIDRLQY